MGQKSYWSWERICYYFFFISRLQKYCTTGFIWKIVWKMFMWVFYAFFLSFSYRGKVIIKGIHNIGIGYDITIIKGEYGRYMGCYSFERNKWFDSFPCFLNIIWISFKILGTWDATVFREIRDLIPFHVFLILFEFLSKY